MNENIKRIAEQSWNRFPHALKFDTERFAESIIKECIDIASSKGDNIDYLKDYFGIK